MEKLLFQQRWLRELWKVVHPGCMSNEHHNHHENSDTTENPYAKADAQFWNSLYEERPARWSGNPNPQLIAEASDLEPGTALDVGCGEGADALWLARRGWKVTGTDISSVALGRAQAHVEGEGVDIEWLEADLTKWDPQGALVRSGVRAVLPHARTRARGIVPCSRRSGRARRAFADRGPLTSRVADRAPSGHAPYTRIRGVAVHRWLEGVGLGVAGT